MSRLVVLLATLALVAVGLLAAGPGGPERERALAALDLHQLFAKPAAEAEAAPDGAARATLGERILSHAMRVSADGSEGSVTLGTLAVEGTADEATLARARRSIARGLREAAAGGVRSFDVQGRLLGKDGAPLARDAEEPKFPGTGTSLAIEGERESASGGVELRARHGGGELGLEWVRDGAPSLVATTPWRAPDRGSLLPPLVAIVLAIATRKPLISLAAGVLLGAVLVRHAAGASVPAALALGAWDVPRVYFWEKVNELDKLQTVAFVVLMLAMVGNLTRNGGLQGLMQLLRPLARGPRSTQATTYGMGLAVFFDDYANTVLVGSTMRSLADRFRIAREKLAYIVDSTAAPVAGISVFSTWIAFEVSTFAPFLPAAGLSAADGYAIFLATLPFRFYCILTLLLVALVVTTGRDAGAMLRAERRTRTTGEVVAPGSRPMVSQGSLAAEMAPGTRPAAWRALVPLFGFIGVTLYEIARVGGAFDMALGRLFTLEGLTTVLYDGSGPWALMIGGAAGFLLASIATTTAGLARDILPAAWHTLRSMGIALGILYFAWMIGEVCRKLGTAQFLAVLSDGALHAALLPALLFVLAAAIAFATGSSWSTMSILLPLVVGLAFQLGETIPIGGYALMLLSIGAVLEGAIFGDHCSPISDTTVLSSIACGSDHMDHVRTQAPYALLTMVVALGLGYVPCAFLGWSPWLALALSAAALVLCVFVVFRPVAREAEA